MITIPPHAKKVLDRIKSCGFEAYIVGGCVRDSLMGKTPGDWDITTSATPDQLMQIFSDHKTIPTGIKHGTVTVLSDSTPVEVTTFRIDGEYEDNRHPLKVNFSRCLNDDLLRRDFTINSMAYNPDTGLIDPYGGESDLKKGLIRAVGDPTKRFTEDALRIMRAIRFSAILGFEIEEDTLSSLSSLSDLLNNISAERIAIELNKLLLSENSPLIGRFFHVVCKRLFGIKPTETAFDTAFSVLGSVPDELPLRLSAFLFQSANLLESNPVELSKAFLSSLKYDTKTRRECITLISNINTKIVPDRINLRFLVKEFGFDSLQNLLTLKKTFSLISETEHHEASGILSIISKEKDCCTVDALALSGLDLAEGFGLSGPDIGAALELLLDGVIREKCENKKDSLLNFFKKESQKS